MLQWNKNERSPISEPYNTLNTHRRQEDGIQGMIFGIYWMADLIESEADFNDLLGQDYKMDFEKVMEINPSYKTVRKGDNIMIRRKARLY